MRRKLATQILVAIVIALTAATAATAEPVSVQPLRDAGYTVAVAFQPSAGCTVWSVSGHGLSTYLNDCDADAAATVASFADPALIFERDWQQNHPDQVQAAQTIANACYSISRTAPATDQWHVVGGTTDTTVAGDQLPGLAGKLPGLRQPDGTCPTGTTAVVVPGTSAPTVTTVTNPDGTTTTTTSSTVTVPGAAPVAAAITTQAAALAAAAAALANPLPPPPPPPVGGTDPTASPSVDPATYTVVASSDEVAADTGIVAWVVTPYTDVPIAAGDVPPATG